MKKGVLVVLLVLVILPIVSAQEINIFGQNYSLILVAPVFFMAIMVLIFLIMLLKDNLSKLNPARIHINFPKHKQSKEEIMKREGVDFVSRYNALKLKISKITVKDYFTEIIQLIKDYLKSKFKGKPSVLNNAIKALRDRHIIVPKEGEKGSYRLLHKGFAIWIKYKASPPKDIKEANGQISH